MISMGCLARRGVCAALVLLVAGATAAAASGGADPRAGETVSSLHFAALPDDATAATAGYPHGSDPGADDFVLSVPDHGILRLRGCLHPEDLCTWERTYGGSREDKANAVVALPDGGFAVAGNTRSHGGMFRDDAWVLRLDRRGEQMWSRTFGGADTDQVYGLTATADGGLVLIGHTRSEGAGESDIWLLKLDRAGDPVWQRVLGGPENDRGHGIAVTADGHLLASGFVTHAPKEGRQAWVARFDPNGALLWERVFPSVAGHAEGSQTLAAANGDAIATGHKYFGGETGYDLWLARLTPAGDILFDRTYGNDVLDAGTALVATPDDGVLVVGAAAPRRIGRSNAWVVRFDAAGEIIWDRTFGGGRSDLAWAALALGEDGYVALASTASQGQGSTDAWLIRLSGDGTVLWERVYGGRLWDRPTAMAATLDGGLVVVGHTTTWGAGFEDIWALRLDRQGRP